MLDWRDPNGFASRYAWRAIPTPPGISIRFNRKDGVDISALRAAADKRALKPEQRLRLMAACAEVGLCP